MKGGKKTRKKIPLKIDKKVHATTSGIVLEYKHRKVTLGQIESTEKSRERMNLED